MRDCFHPFVEATSLARISVGCEVLGCQAEEHVMASACFLWANGDRCWSITHESDRGVYDLTIAGAPPSQFAGIQGRAQSQQDAEGGDDADVDLVYDVPIDLAAELCGYRHDQIYDTSAHPFAPKYSFTTLVSSNA